ncbi:ribonuclease domain-containing protein [Rhodococcus sp. SGAir0479]|uniref:ribonuclease domain-containing protein n=1 Tax=Rhodococcus sp. SGAir0479 TaxID=2567884 RepID=UPI0010CD230F|nr:ribonuclease domain-containing protein [Rhodococcus sp. SGAir0479]QCQ92084.1 ribonuclease [Rhodococcus sp. SGAir0479]
MASQRKSPIVALLVALAGLAVAVFVGTQAGGDDASSAASPVSVTSSASVSVSSSASVSVSPTRTTEQATGIPQASGVPQAAWATLAAIDAGRWPPSDAPGTEGGRTFGNHEGRLPATGSGQQIRYQEWDVNRKQSGRGRDGHRIVTGSDGSAWYTDDHYETFTRMR